MKIKLILVVVVTLFLSSACNPVPQDTVSAPAAEKPMLMDSADNPPEESNCSMNIGFDSWEPYQYVNVNGEILGLDIELISSVIEGMGCNISYTQGTWVSLLEELKQGRIDLLLGASKTEARGEYAYFGDSYRMEEFSLYIRKGDTKRAAYKDIDEFISNGSRIGIVGEYYYGPSISIMLDGSATSKLFVPAMMGEMNIGRLLDEDIDGFLEDSFVGASILRRKALNSYIEPHGYTVETGDIFVMFSKQSVSAEQVSAFNTALAAQKETNEYQQILEKFSRSQ